MDLRARALRLLARRERSRAELKRKLAPYGRADEIEALLDALQGEGWLSDARYAEAVLQAKVGRQGSRRIEHSLRQQGLSAELIAASVASARAHDLEACRALWARRFGVVATQARERARQYRFLLGRGFPAEVVAQVVGGPADETWETSE
ncbi:MAG: recombination regulator RecX [Thiobacillaceae bacterium]|nr:recombination regulator RecX [Thiobacillaceae bacterium]MCX7672984.1 recombination regulator RecX [Thiobacillaceae bacterium]MDW8323447.1 recombination regulator RecX [Burkholderiales bacterium]